MPVRAFEGLPERSLLSGAAGDVLAARAAASELLGVAPLSDRTLATLVLSAVLLHCAARNGGDATWSVVVATLRQLIDADMPGPALLRSPMQFVRYVAVELRAVPAGGRRRFLSEVLAVLQGTALKPR